MNKQICKTILAAFVLAFLLPLQVFAQSNDSFELDTQGKVTLVSSHAAREGISSLQFSLEIKSASADKVEFQFDSNTAKVSEFRYHEDTGILNIYIAGTEALFDENNPELLTIGRVVVLDTRQNDTPATISVVPDSLYYVYGTELKQAEDLKVPEAVTINGGSGGSGGSSSGSQGTDGSNNTQSQGNGDSSGNTTSNSQGTASSSQNTASGGQNSGSNTSNGQQSSDSNGTSTAPLAENYTRLKQTFENARAFKEEDYSSESYKALQAAMARAEEVLGAPNATSSEIDEVLIELENAIGALVTKGDDAADDIQQSSGQETGEASEQIGDESTGNKAKDSRLTIFLLIAGVLALVGCGTAVLVFKLGSKQYYEDD